MTLKKSRGLFLILLLVFLLTAVAHADPLHCDLTKYTPSNGLAAAIEKDALVVTWQGVNDQELRLQFVIRDGTPVVREVAIRSHQGDWNIVATNLIPEFRVVSGLRRITNQQLDPLAGLGVKITPEILNRDKWAAFWDAPLNVPGGESAHNNNTPPHDGVLDQPGLPRRPEEIHRGSAVYHSQGCAVRTDGARIEITFPGVGLGVFEGRLVYVVYRGTNLIRQEVIAKTEMPSVAYKYEAGVSGMKAGKVVWRDLSNHAKDHRPGAAKAEHAVVVKANNRVIEADAPGGSIAAFPPPHNFFWARETDYNLGYNWYREDNGVIAFGVRQPDREESAAQENRGPEDRQQNFALRNARPGTWQHMPVYFYVDGGEAAIDGALAFTRADHFAALDGYKVMATHFHMGLVAQAMRAGGLSASVPDLEVMRAAGIDIVAPIDGGGAVSVEPGPRGKMPPREDPKWKQWSGRGYTFTDPRPGGASSDPFASLAEYYTAAIQHSDSHFIVMANAEVLRGPVADALGAHNDILFSHPVFWQQGRNPGQPLFEKNPKYGTIYHIGTAADMMEMAHHENLILYMPHPRSKGSTGFPDAIKDTPHFLDPNYRGIGFRWGMGLDGSEIRLCEYRCLPTLDDMNNWMADKPGPAKFVQAISEIYRQGHGDDIYANNPVNYVKLDRLPPPGEWAPVIDAMKRGDYFVTSGEVLIPSIEITGTGDQRSLEAEVQWTFPLDFVEVVWGDGQHTDRQVISTTDLPPFGRRHFSIPFRATGKKWIRFAAWDSAGNGALAQPVKLRP